MTPLFAADWLSISINLLLVIHVIVCLLLALLVLMQRPKQEGLGAAFGAGLTDQAFGARTTDVLQKGTVYLGTLFFIVTLVLAILIGKRQNDNPTLKGIVDDELTVESVETAGSPVDEEAVTMPEIPEAPTPPTEAEVPEIPTPETGATE
ncbi:MAG: preprotein translocase subunit SecG [Akkermansiaceae bacterium]